MRRLFLSLLFLFPFIVSAVSQSNKNPKFVMFIVVDGLDNNTFNILQQKLPNDGFRKIVSEGHRYMSLVSSDFAGYHGTQISTFLSGTTPEKHGIIGKKWYDKKSNELISVLGADSIFYNEVGKKSSRGILPDYLKYFYGENVENVSFTINSPWMIHTLGVAPSSFFEIDKHKGDYKNSLKIDSTSFDWANKLNLKTYLNKSWHPQSDITKYEEFLRDSNKVAQKFKHIIDKDISKGLGQVVNSPFGNSLTRDAVVSYLANTQFGKDERTDFISIYFSLNPYVNRTDDWLSAEKEDMFISLDRNIASLVEFLDFEYGKDNYLLIVMGVPNDKIAIKRGKQGVDYGVVEKKKVVSLLNFYLMALHGQGDWVLGMYDNQVFLNRDLIASKAMSLKDIQEESALFLMDVAGIERVYPTYEMLFAHELNEPFKSNFYPNRSGDLFYIIKKGWHTDNGDGLGVQLSTNGSKLIPLIMRGWEVERGATIDKVKLEEVIPTILKNMGISIEL